MYVLAECVKAEKDVFVKTSMPLHDACVKLHETVVYIEIRIFLESGGTLFHQHNAENLLQMPEVETVSQLVLESRVLAHDDVRTVAVAAFNRKFVADFLHFDIGIHPVVQQYQHIHDDEAAPFCQHGALAFEDTDNLDGLSE